LKTKQCSDGLETDVAAVLLLF